MRLAMAAILGVLLIFLLMQVRGFSLRNETARKEYERLTADLNRAQRDRAALQSDFTYFSNPLNVEKELRARFNYRASGETLIIIVPSSSVSSSR